MTEEIRYFVFKANVPLKDDKDMLDWDKSCKGKSPEGHDDYRWGKMMHDHYFTKNFRPILVQLGERLAKIESKLDELSKKKEEASANDGLFK